MTRPVPGPRYAATAAWTRACLLVLVCACSSRSERADDGAPVQARVVAEAIFEAITVEPVAPSDEQVRRYRRHLAAGRRLADARRYGEAARELESALEALPMDARALSELGWATLMAGDHDRARRAIHDALRVAPDSALRAASLYNLGRLAEAMGDLDEAGRAYRESLALRPHDGVAARLEALGQAPPPRRAALPRCKPAPAAAELCPCVSPGASTCHEEPRQVPDVALLFSGDSASEAVHLVARGQAGWSPVARLGTVRHGDGGRVHQELEVVRMDTELLGERTLVRVETLETREEETRAGVRVRRVALLTLCTWRDAGLECPLQVPTREESERRPAAGEHATPSLERHIDVEVADSGVIKVVLIAGARTDDVASVLGEHRLW